ncbi:hypothetical protein CALCODRAFT_220347 [Calocera cornea HHB12733]|uniref:Secreted protein n=1 Tax=Calocera cornea HHB12733 TaxID=1353952 RepID=A0A165H9F3_9BASI|nr:hypothetical protein CALCODRAFT_220347 [Calocera cornea HHB12733]
MFWVLSLISALPLCNTSSASTLSLTFTHSLGATICGFPPVVLIPSVRRFQCKPVHWSSQLLEISLRSHDGGWM